MEFPDGETIIGYEIGSSPQRYGFMMTPADLGGNNERIFVVNSATKSVNFLTEGQAPPKTPKPKSQDVHMKEEVERRKHPRVTLADLLSYDSFDEEDKPLERGMGKTLDISLGGLLMKTKVPIEGQYILLTAINIREEPVRIKGQVVHSREVEPGIFHTGIRFEEKTERVHEIVTDMIKLTLKKKRTY